MSGSVFVAGTAQASSPDDTYLDALQGQWLMRGTLGGAPVTYRAVGQRILGGAWLKLHMFGIEQPPRYQADVFLGYDAKAHDFIVHWLDQFGAAGAQVVATGYRDGERLPMPRERFVTPSAETRHTTCGRAPRS